MEFSDKIYIGTVSAYMIERFLNGLVVKIMVIILRLG